MPEELGNLLIRVTSVGFDEVIESLNELEAAASEVSSNSSFAELQDAVNEIAECVEDLTEGMRAATHGFTGFGAGAHEAGQHVDATTQKLKENQSVLATLAKAYASFWVMFNAPRKLFDTLDGVAKFNRELTSMSVSSNMSRGALLALGTAAAQFGGSTHGIASLGGRFQAQLQNLRIGRGGGALQEAATLYGLNITGHDDGGLATPEEVLEHLAELLPKLSKNNQLGIKNLLGIPDGEFRLLKQGLEVYKQVIAEREKNEKLLEESEKKTEEWNKATAKLDLQWQLLQNEVFKQLEPIVKDIVGYVTKATEYLQKHPEFLSKIYATVTAIATTIAAIEFTKIIVGLAAMVLKLKEAHGWWEKLKTLFGYGGGAAGGAAGGVAGGAAGGVGGAAAGIAGGSVGQIINALKLSGRISGLGAVSTGVTNLNTANSVDVLMERVLWPWFTMWQAVTFKDGLSETAYNGMIDQAIDDHATHSMLFGLIKWKDEGTELYKEAVKKARRVEEMIGRGEDSASTGRGARKSGAVSIAGITINVTSSAANAEDVAKAVREEFFAQVNASIEDAVNGSRVL